MQRIQSALETLLIQKQMSIRWMERQKVTFDLHHFNTSDRSLRFA